jgi:N-acetylmuramoyl-L-alanine amidase
MLLRLAFVWLAVVLTLAGGRTLAQTPPLTARIGNTGYVRLSEWAKWHGLQWRWLKRDESFQLTNKVVRLQFAVDSRAARVNGVQLWLLHPLVTRGGDIYLSQLDADTTLRPLLAPPRNEPKKKVHSICLDAGHGGRDPGNRAGARLEKDLTLRLASELRDQLQKAGFKVVFTRTSDQFIELSDRPAIARQRGADLFVSLHFNGAGNSAAQGSEVFCMTPVGAASTNAGGEGGGAGSYSGNRNNAQNLLLAFQIQRSLLGILRSEDRGVRRARFEVLRGATMPAVLIEAGFLSHPVEGKKILTVEYRRQMARAIVAGIQSYKKVVER